ncbi:hypothetical protein H8959_017996 [Pygathrix nigripes]
MGCGFVLRYPRPALSLRLRTPYSGPNLPVLTSCVGYDGLHHNLLYFLALATVRHGEISQRAKPHAASESNFRNKEPEAEFRLDSSVVVERVGRQEAQTSGLPPLAVGRGRSAFQSQTAGSLQLRIQLSHFVERVTVQVATEGGDLP